MQHSNWALKYGLTEDCTTSENGEARITYGLACFGSHPRLGPNALLASLPDISPDQRYVHAMAELFTIGALPPERLREVVAVLL